MTTFVGQALHTRETLAGYDRTVMEKGVVTIVGCGASGSNIAQTLALSGVGEIRLVDPDTVDASNLTRSPLLAREKALGARPRFKANEIGRALLNLSTATTPRVRLATNSIEALGTLGLEGSGVVVAALDSLQGRAYLADQTRQLGIPLVELGFHGAEGHISVFRNRTPEEPCWRCLHPNVERGRLSCRDYARAVVARGAIPATQSVAATFGALAAEAAIQALHGRFDLGGYHLGLDIRSGRSNRVAIVSEPACPGIHKRLCEVEALDLTVNATGEELLAALAMKHAEPLVHLPTPYIVQAACARCGADVRIDRPDWSLAEAPICRKGCAERRTLGGLGVVVVSSLRRGDPLISVSLKALGFAPGTCFLTEDQTSGSVRYHRLQGALDDLYVTRMMGSRAETSSVATSNER